MNEEKYTTYRIAPAADQAAVDYVYAHLKNFWFQRHNLPMSKEQEEALLKDYQETYFRTERAPLTEMLKSFCDDQSPTSALSFAEVGGANGTTLHYLKSILDLSRVRYVGLEPYALFREDFNFHFPDQKMLDGDLEGFANLDIVDDTDLPVSAVLCYGVMCMAPQRIVRAFLQRAAQMTDDILGFDYCIDFDGALPKTNQWMFYYNEEQGQLYFVHPFKDYLDEIGFETIKRENMIHADNKVGWQAFHFRRKQEA